MNILEELGYNVDDYAIPIFKDIISETIEALNKYEINQVRELIYNKKSYIYVELGYFCYEIGVNNLYRELMRIHNERNSNNLTISKKVFKDNLEPNLEDSILCIATYINDLRKENGNKIKIKK